MKKFESLKRIFAAMLCLAMAIGVFPIIASAAKARVTTLGSVSITGITAPKAGELPDFTADVASDAHYEVVKVIWQTAITLKEISETSRFNGALNYEVVVILKAKDSYKFGVSSGMPNVTATIDGSSANVGGVPNEPTMSDASKYIRVVKGFQTKKGDPVESFNVIVQKPEPGAKPATKVRIDTLNNKENKGYINVDKLEWTLQNGDPMGDRFEFGETYLLHLTLSAVNGREFVPDPTNILSTKDNPMPKVNVTVNGESSSAFPINGVPVEDTIQVIHVFRLTDAKKLKEINIDNLSAPVTGESPTYIAIAPAGVDFADTSSGTTRNGITWIEAGSSAIPTFGFSFEANTQYIVKVELEAEKGYAFDDPTVKIGGKTATVVDWTKDKLTATYAFPTTGNKIIKSVSLYGIDAPETGESPDYTVEFDSIAYELEDSIDRFTSDGVMWYNEEKKSGVYVGAEKFEEGKTYTVIINLTANDGYDFAYKNGKPQVTATVNGKIAEVSGRSEYELVVRYTFPKIEAHKCTLKKVDEVKATCKQAGKEEYYLCSECGKAYEDEKGTKQIANIKKWGEIEKLEHTGGSATCKEQAKCKVCGASYGELKEHNFGTTWGYTDALFHAHTCKTCGTPDTSEPHSGGKATCKALAKCEKCRTEYGNYGAHKFNSKNKCTLCDYQLPFTDVKNSDYFIDAVAWALDNGVTTGMSADTFGPELTCTRGQVVTFLWRASGKPEPQSKVNPFTDVAETDYFYTAVLWAVENGITNGTSQTEFSPNQTCSTAHIITFLYRSVNEGANGWYEEAAKWADDNGLVAVTGLTVDPTTPCPRGAVVTFLKGIFSFD